MGGRVLRPPIMYLALNKSTIQEKVIYVLGERFVSRSRNYSVSIQPKVVVNTLEGPIVKQDDIVAQFEWVGRDGLDRHELDAAMEAFTFNGLAEHDDARDYLSIFDTAVAAEINEWDEETHKKVIDKLLRLSNSNEGFYIHLPRQAAAKPWPKYDEQSIDQILVAAEATEQVSEAIAYETENKARAEVLAALEALASGEKPQEVEETPEVEAPKVEGDEFVEA